MGGSCAETKGGKTTGVATESEPERAEASAEERDTAVECEPRALRPALDGMAVGLPARAVSGSGSGRRQRHNGYFK